MMKQGNKLKYKRVLLKLSGEALEGQRDHGIDFSYLKVLGNQIKEVVQLGVELVIVIGGGNFWRYRDFKDSAIERTSSDYMGMIATIMNSIAMQSGLEKMGLKAKAFSAIDVPVILETYYRRKAIEDLEKGTIVVCAGGTGNPYFTTDSAAALRAAELQCEIILKATNVDYVFDKDPNKNKNAKPYKKVSYMEVLEKRLGVMDLSAIAMSRDANIPILVFNLLKKNNIIKAIKGEKVGTLIY